MRLVRYTYPTNRSYYSSALTTRTPWSGLETEIDRLFGSALGTAAVRSFEGSFPVDLYQDKENAFVRAELPGVNREAIDIEVADGVLAIKANRTRGEGDKAETLTFNRSISLPDDVQSESVRAAYENGVLTITLPKKEEAKPKKVTVQVS